MQKTAIVCVTSDLTTDQRVHRTCMTLQKSGYWVIAYGRLLPDSLKLERSYFTLRKKLWFNWGPLFYAEYNIRLFFHLLYANVDLIFANDLDTLPAAYIVSKLRKKKIIFDAHELFPELPELTHRPFTKKIWGYIEKGILPKLDQTITVCQSIADYYKERYQLNMQVVRNIPTKKTVVFSKKTILPKKKILLYQGAINVGRGLEWIIDAMPLLPEATLIIIGDGDIKKQLEQKVTKAELNNVLFLGKIGAEELYQYTCSADIGLCLLENMGLNYYYALPNRIFDYIHAGIPVLASPFPEIKAIVEKYQSGILTDNYKPEALSDTIRKMLNNTIDKDHFSEIASELCWENEEKILISLINQ